MKLRHWKVKFGGRDLGAIGIMVRREEHVTGVDLNAAILTLYDKFEEVMGLQHMELEDVMMKPKAEWFYRSNGTLWGPKHTCPSCGVGRWKKYRGLGEYSHDPYRICTDCGILGCDECIRHLYRRIDDKPIQIFKCKGQCNDATG